MQKLSSHCHWTEIGIVSSVFNQSGLTQRLIEGTRWFPDTKPENAGFFGEGFHPHTYLFLDGFGNIKSLGAEGRGWVTKAYFLLNSICYRVIYER